jgi:hypothetical protein
VKRRSNFWSWVALLWVMFCFGAVIVAVANGYWSAIVPVVLILAITMPNYAKHRRT